MAFFESKHHFNFPDRCSICLAHHPDTTKKISLTRQMATGGTEDRMLWVPICKSCKKKIHSFYWYFASGPIVAVLIILGLVLCAHYYFNNDQGLLNLALWAFLGGLIWAIGWGFAQMVYTPIRTLPRLWLGLDVDVFLMRVVFPVY